MRNHNDADYDVNTAYAIVTIIFIILTLMTVAQNIHNARLNAQSHAQMQEIVAAMEPGDKYIGGQIVTKEMQEEAARDYKIQMSEVSNN